MVFYSLLAVLVLTFFIITYRYPKKENIISLVLLIIIIGIGGFRDRIGWDYVNYTNWYLNGTRDDGLEFGFLALMNVFRYFKIDYHFFFFFFSFFTYLFVYLGIKKYALNTTLPLVLYILIPVCFLYSFTYIRQFLAIAIAFYAFSYLLEKKYLIYLLLMFIGVSMHYSCIIPFVLFILVFILGDLIKLKYLYLLIIISFIIAQIGLIHVLSFFLKGSHYSYYVSQKFAVPVPILKLIVFNVIGFFVVWYYSVNGFINSSKKYLLLLYILSIVILNLFSESTELTRIYIYFRIFEIILVADIVRKALSNQKHLILVIFVCCFYLLPFFRAIKIDSEIGPKGLKLIPYKSLLCSIVE